MAERACGRLVIEVHDRRGVLARIATLFDRRGLSICRLAVEASGEPDRAQLTVEVAAGGEEVERLVLALANLVDVLAVRAADG